MRRRPYASLQAISRNSYRSSQPHCYNVEPDLIVTEMLALPSNSSIYKHDSNNTYGKTTPICGIISIVQSFVCESRCVLVSGHVYLGEGWQRYGCSVRGSGRRPDGEERFDKHHP